MVVQSQGAWRLSMEPIEGGRTGAEGLGALGGGADSVVKVVLVAGRRRRRHHRRRGRPGAAGEGAVAEHVSRVKPRATSLAHGHRHQAAWRPKGLHSSPAFPPKGQARGRAGRRAHPSRPGPRPTLQRHSSHCQSRRTRCCRSRLRPSRRRERSRPAPACTPGANVLSGGACDGRFRG